MKKTISAITCVLALTGAAFAQGNVNWNTLSAAAITWSTNSTQNSPYFGGTATGGGSTGPAGGSAIGGTGFYYELLIGSVYTGTAEAAPTTVSALQTWTDSGLEATNSNTSGRVTTINPNAGATVAALSTTVSNNIILVGWSANLGSTFAAALSDLQNPNNIVGPGFFGESSVGFIEGASTSTSPGSSVVGTAATTAGTPIDSLLTPLYAIPTPEPGTIALAAIGGASLLMFRRKK